VNCDYSESVLKRVLEELGEQQKGIVEIFACLLIITFIACMVCPHKLLAGFLLLFVCVPMITWLLRAIISMTGQVLTLRDELLHVAFQECCCKRKDSCYVCQIRDLLYKKYPRAIPDKIREYERMGWHLPED
jgi:hypothetical protein